MAYMNKTTTRNNEITEEMMKDSRLFPLFCDTTKLLIQLFVLEIKNNGTNEKTYKIVYGLCIRTTRDVSDEYFCSDFNKVYTSIDNTYSISKISIYNYPSIIIDLVNELLLGRSLKNASDKLNADKLNFDVFYAKNFRIRPVIFNETNTTISRNPYEKNALISPFKDIPSFTLTVCNLDKIDILFIDDKVEKSALLAVLEYLQEETNLPFLTAGCIRFGNIEFINTQCADEFEVGYVNSGTIKETITIDCKEEVTCKKISISIEPNIYTCSKKLLINCFLKNGEQVILDECKEIFHEEGEKLTTIFESQEQIGSVSISIWREESAAFQIWYKYSVTMCRQIQFNMGMVGLQGIVQSPWLEAIENSNKKTKEKISEVKKISKTSYQTSTIGRYTQDPWVEIDRNFSKYVNRINPKKSDAEFFPQGWNAKTEEHGSISFLEWFKKQTQDAKKVVIQDPFYDTLGLEFLVRTTNAGTDFVILTCTQTISTDDDQKDTRNNTEPNRAIRIKSFISSNPSLCDSLKLSIYDMRSTGGGDTNLLHDRYILIFDGNILQKGFHLSNSIQGATKKQPLLITPIPQDVLRKIDIHINDLINKAEVKNNIKIIPLHNYKNTNEKIENNDEKKIANPKLYDQLKQEITKDENVSKNVVENFISKAISKKTFPEFWATFGYLLATTNHNDKIISILETVDNPMFAVELRKYMESTISAKFPLGFSEERRFLEYDFRFLFVEKFKDIIEKVLQLGDYISETYGYGNYGVYYGCDLLLNINFNEYVTLIEFIKNQYIRNKNLKNDPLSKLSTILFTNLLESLLWRDDSGVLTEKILHSNIPFMKAVATSALISNILKETPSVTFDEFKRLLLNNLSIDESLCAFVICLLNHKFRNRHIDTALESNVLSSISSVLVGNYSKDRLENMFKQILYSYYPSIEKKFAEEVLFKLETKNIINAKAIFQLWSDEFLALIGNFDSVRNYSGIIDMTGWSFQIIDKKDKDMFVEKLRRLLKKEINEIRKPFRKETKEWNTSFERILLIKTVIMIAVLYTRETTDCSDEIQIINEIGKLEKNYQYSKDYSTIYSFSQQIETEYKKVI